MLVGMGTVFVFLTLLVIGMSVMSAIATRFIVSASNEAATDEEVAAITSAIIQHRNKTAK